MKVLITGVTARMIGSTRLRYNYLSNVSLIEKALKLAGHEVETRKVKLTEEDVHKNYDIALVGMANCFSLGAGYFPEATRILHDFGSRAAIYADDWSFVGFGETVRGCLRGWDQWLRWRNYSHTTDRDLACLKSTLMRIGERQCAWPVMVPMFGWGNGSEFMEGNLYVHPNDICAFDPTNLYDMPAFNTVPQKDRFWVLAALQKHYGWMKKLELDWPVLEYGNKREGQQILTEDEVIQEYAENWGVLAPKYPKAGTGWWRVRYIHAAKTGSVLLCDPKDGEAIGPSYCIPARKIECLGDANLAELAAEQASELLAHSPTAEAVSRQIDQFVTEILRTA